MTGMTVMFMLARGLFYFQQAIVVAILVLAIAALITVATTREDAFTVIDRQKQNWILLSGGATALAALSMFVNMEMLWIIAAVIVGIYWQDVRPGINDALGNAGGSW
ncbi:DUF2516 family protein [uncultured Corynebacterium sp.]|uniref:DUF2516 family protein n=1 Tax=uncultured Corynebacterium sp. TaxID=159447 RepID=UPI0025E785BC|nr:DUF2516 family protein [uncultured Corynebacterium sp.]